MQPDKEPKPTEKNRGDEEALRQAVGLYLEALRFAGLEWLPKPLSAPEPRARPAPHQGASRLDASDVVPTTPSRQAVSNTGGAPGPEKHDRESARAAFRGLSDSLFDQPLVSPTRDTAEKARALEELNRLHVVPCTKCAELVRNRTQTVFGVGNPNAELVFVGEAPGQEEDAQGEPFVGPAGQLLNRILAACGLRREEVYICNVLKCRPPNNRAPLPHEIANCRGYLDQQLTIIAPKYICCLGAIAAQTLLQTNQSISKLRGKVHRYRGALLICTYHPAYLLRNPQAKREVWEDMQLLLRTMGRPIPQRKPNERGFS
ncbi:MAG: uracil-DNA glycosylase [Gemmatales bacterium]|nr:uracil-DNA glycosylase [Gemmatales bacterium]MDW7993558.1 uracil-DNA glycosylase [Gemmatales bacterium]